MKTVQYATFQFEINDSINFLATDADGNIFGYDVEPFIPSGCDFWSADTDIIEHIGDVGIQVTNFDATLKHV